MRLVSAIWDGFHPFDALPFIDDCTSTSDPEDLREGDFLVLHGGEDISPTLYHKGRSSMSGADANPSKRDLIEWRLIHKAVSLGVPIFGICRGAQMLCAAAGGSLIQHVNGHGRSHEIETNTGDTLYVNSLHHQMMHPENTDHELLAWSKHLRSDVYYDVDNNIALTCEPEYIYFPKLKGFAAQWHPEMMAGNTPATLYLFNHIKQVLNA